MPFPHSLGARLNATTWVQLFGSTNKATWPKSLKSSAKVSCHGSLWIRSQPVSVVTVCPGPIKRKHNGLTGAQTSLSRKCLLLRGETYNFARGMHSDFFCEYATFSLLGEMFHSRCVCGKPLFSGLEFMLLVDYKYIHGCFAFSPC